LLFENTCKLLPEGEKGEGRPTPNKKVKRGKRGKEDSASTTADTSGSTLPAHVNDVVTPLWRIPYSQQLEQKKRQMLKVLRTTVQRVRKSSQYNLPEWVKRVKGKTLCCKLEAMVPSPVERAYRNKVSFTIGLDAHSQKCIGFSLGSTAQAVTIVADVADCVNVSEEAKQARNLIQELVAASPLPVYDKINHTGFWRELCVRSNLKGEAGGAGSDAPNTSERGGGIGRPT
jgi:tRNA (uracil-5-)-methyltransferase